MKKRIIIAVSIFFVVLLVGSMFSQAEAFFNKKLKNRIADLEIEVEMLKEAKQIQGKQMAQEVKKSQNQLSDANKKIEGLQAKLQEAEKRLDVCKKAEEKNKKQLDKYVELQKKYEEEKARADKLEKKCNALLVEKDQAAIAESAGETLETEMPDLVEITE